MEAERVVKKVKYIPVEDATIGSKSIHIKYVLKIAPGPMPQNATTNEPM